MVMTKPKNLIQGNVSAELKEEFDRQLDDQGFGVGRAVEAMVKLWVSLPYELQTLLVRRTTTGEEFQQMIREIVDNRLAELVRLQNTAGSGVYPPGTKVTLAIVTAEEQVLLQEGRQEAGLNVSDESLHHAIQAKGKSQRGNRGHKTG